MWIKICANTNLEDALLAADLGADALGFVFATSSRRVTPGQAAAIVRHLPPNLEKIGVFSSHDADEIVGIVRAVGLTGAQLHGGDDLLLVRALHESLPEGTTIIQTLHWVIENGADNAGKVAAQLRQIASEPGVNRVLIDSKVADSSGGTGKAFDWLAAKEAIPTETSAAGPKLILAGGLRPDNVELAVATLDPWGVDVASGVEIVPGKKDPLKLRQFIENARA